MPHKYREILGTGETEGVWIINVIEDARNNEGIGCVSYSTHFESRHRVQSEDDVRKRWVLKLKDQPSFERIEIKIYAADLTGVNHIHKPHG